MSDFYVTGWKLLEKLEAAQTQRSRAPGVFYSNRTHCLDEDASAPQAKVAPATHPPLCSSTASTTSTTQPTSTTKPVILGVLPSKAAAGASVKVYGNHFDVSTRATFGAVPAMTSRTENARCIICTVPQPRVVPTVVQVRVEGA